MLLNALVIAQQILYIQGDKMNQNTSNSTVEIEKNILEQARLKLEQDKQEQDKRQADANLKLEQDKLELDKRQAADNLKLAQDKLELDKRLADDKLRQEKELKVKEIHSNRWSPVLLVGIVAAIIGLVGTFVNGYQSNKLEKIKQEGNLVLEAIKTNNDPHQAAVNLLFLSDSKLINLQTEQISALRKVVPQGTGLPSLPSGSGTGTQAATYNIDEAIKSGEWIVKSFTPEEFRGYVGDLKFEKWKPQFVVLHHSSLPTLAQKPNGISLADAKNIASFYAGTQKWSGGMHILVDQSHIWVLNPLTRPGVHAPSWNKVSWGVMMLGDYDKEDPLSGDGKMVFDNAADAIATLDMAAGIMPTSLKLHREDPKTTHTCPGIKVQKDKVIERITQIIAQRKIAH